MKHLLDGTFALVLCAGAFAVGTSACALTSKADLVETRYFSPERVKPRLDSATTGGPRAPARGDAIELRLGRVSSGPNLRERIAYRDAAFELGFYEELRWAERPEVYIRRAFGRALFEDHGLRRVLQGTAPTLEVEVIAFDDLRLKTGRAARVQLKVMLYEDSVVLFEDTVTVDRAVAGDKPTIEAVIASMALALDAVTDEVAARIERALTSRRSVISAPSSPAR
jgi:cholesterol transport system auxiliary component